MMRAYRTDLRQLNEQNYARFDAKLEQRLAELRGELRSEIASLRGDVRADLQTLKADLIKWMVGFWVVSLLTTIGGIAALARLLP